MLTMNLSLNIDAQRMIQQVQIHNKQIEDQVEAGLNKAIEELSKEGVIENMIAEAAKKNIMDTFSRWIFRSDIRKNIEKAITEKMSKRVDEFTNKLVDELANKLNLPKEDA